MERIFIEEKIFEKNDFTHTPLLKGEYEYCTFLNCNFSSSDLTDITFLECEFVGCNLSLIKPANTAFRDVKFKDNKMLGIRFETCNEFGLSFIFDNCNLDHSSFYQKKLKEILFKNSHLHEVDFTECELISAVFDNCDLAGAVFEKSNLEKADFRTSINYSIDPESNRIKKARFTLAGLPGLLDKYNIDIDNGISRQ